jgi:hypothetical protein
VDFDRYMTWRVRALYGLAVFAVLLSLTMWSANTGAAIAMGVIGILMGVGTALTFGRPGRR